MSARADLFSGVLPFVRTAEEKSFSRAASELGVTTAAVSKAVKKLEGELGVKLLERSSRLVTLTKAGQTFLERCRQAVLTMQGAHEAMQGATKEPQGELTVTMPFILAPFVVPRIGRFSAQYPRLSFRFNMSDRLARLADESYDVAIRMGELDNSSLVARALRKTSVGDGGGAELRRPVRCAEDPRGPRAAQLPAFRRSEWEGAGLDLSRRRSLGRQPPYRGNLLIDHGTWLLGAAESGLGICQALDFMVEAPLREGRLVEVLTGFSAPGPRIHALDHRRPCELAQRPGLHALPRRRLQRLTSPPLRALASRSPSSFKAPIVQTRGAMRVEIHARGEQEQAWRSRLATCTSSARSSPRLPRSRAGVSFTWSRCAGSRAATTPSCARHAMPRSSFECPRRRSSIAKRGRRAGSC
jgi:LysR family transcriptional regulator for bpeEF and oprC